MRISLRMVIPYDGLQFCTAQSDVIISYLVLLYFYPCFIFITLAAWLAVPTIFTCPSFFLPPVSLQ